MEPTAAAMNDARTATEAETLLFLAARAGDPRAFARLARMIARPSLALATRVLGNAALAEEAVQEALTRAWREQARFDVSRGSFGAWWRRILLNAALDGRRRLRTVVPLEDAGDPADPAPDPEARAGAAALDRALAAAMARLPPRQRAALALFHGEGLSMAEIAAALETTPKAIEGLLGRGREQLKDMLKAMGHDTHE
jgi:RNA polymerase sigma-70 factor (ECF subfamily)